MNYKPRHLNLHLTDRCNNLCRYCYIGSTNHDTQKSENKLDITTVNRVIDEFFGVVQNPNPKIILTGGEPTLTFNTLTGALQHIQSNYPQAIPEMYTNGGIISAIGRYKETIKPILKRVGVIQYQSEELITKLKQSGLKSIVVSVDHNHTTTEDNSNGNQVPLYCIKDLFSNLLKQGYGKGEYQLTLDVSYSDAEKEQSEQIIEELTSFLGFKRQRDIYVKGDRKISRRGVVGFTLVGRVGETQKEPISKEDASNLTCEKLNSMQNSYGPLCFNHEHGPDIDSNGDVYFCNGQSFLIGNIHENSLQEVFQRLDQNNQSIKRYAPSIALLNIIHNISQKRNDNCIGTLIQTVLKKKPDFLTEINNSASFCWRLTRDKELQDIILNHF